MMLTCEMCETEFERPGSRGALPRWCCKCRKQRDREYKRNRDQRAAQLRWRYGIEPEDFDRMVAAQNGLCAVCQRKPAAHVDHDHETGEVRGILCLNCNAGIGQLQDDPEVLRSALDYLERV